MTKILFFAHDPGGINAITPLIEPLKNEGFEVISYFKILPKNILHDFKPDIIITGTSANDKTEKRLWQEAKELKIKSVAILDHWANYGIRFSKWGLKEIENFNKNPDIFPNYIIVMDEFAKKEAINDGIPEGIILPLGNPHFETIKHKATTPFNPDPSLIVFASEPYIEDYGTGLEKIAAKDIIDFCSKNGKNVIIKLHPKESVEKYKEFERENVVLNKETPLTEIMKKASLTISMTSMALIEGAILGLPILSYQPQSISPDKLILTKNGVLPFITNKEELCKYLNTIVLNKKPLDYNFNIDFDAIKRITEFLKEGICQN